LELLEDRRNELIVLTDDRKLFVFGKNSYTILKYKYYLGKKIRFIGTDPTGTALVQEKEDGVFACTFNGETLTMPQDSKIPLSNAILESHSSEGRLDAIHSLWKLKYIEQFLGIKINEGASRFVELTRQGHLFLPDTVRLEILDWKERPDKARVAKMIFENKDNSNATKDRIFTHEITNKRGRQTIVVNSIAVALIGCDEVGQFWMHFVPPEYKGNSISMCELWLAGGEYGKDELID
jgi:hypothetical protein